MGRRSRSASRSVSRSPSAGHTSSRRRREGGGGHARPRDRSRSRQRSRRSPSRSRSPCRSRRDDERSKPKDKEDKPREEDKGPKTTEENGEISMSIEETNKLRISLGLKPLSVGPKKEKNLVNLQKTSEQLAEEKERDEIKKALEQSRRKRELTQKLAGKSIGQELKESAASSALDWIKQSRQSAAQQAAAAKKAQKKQKEADGTSYDASALAGMTVSHDVDAFDEGVDVVLTLKDSRVLTEDGGDVNDEADELMNVELSERDRLETRQKQAQRANMPVYTGYDDDEFIQMGVTKKKKKLLAHYDADEEQKADDEAKKFTLDAAGRSQISAKAKAKAAQDEALDGVEVVSLSMNKSKAMEDYYTQEEMEATFAKKSKKMRKKKKLRKKLEEEEENEGDASALLAQLEAEAHQNNKGSSDRGKRRRPVHDDDDGRDHVLASAEEEGLRRFQEAREKANTVASSALEASTGIKKKKRRAAAWEDGEDALDLELSANVARSRHLAQLKQQQEEGSATLQSREAKLAALVSQAIGDEPDKVDGDVSMVAAGNVFVETETSNTVVFNDATDFETRLRSAMEQRTVQFQATASASTTTTTSTEVSSKEVKEEEDGEAMEIDSDKEETEQEKDEDDESKTGESWGDEQPLVAGGMGATLALLRRTGELRETRVERQAGRANDSRDRNVDDEFRVKDGVKLDYRDEFGRLLTKKEAFRMLSYKFHGHKPGKKKQEKRLKQLKEELEAQKALSGEGSTKMMKVLEKKQQHAQQAFVVLSNGS